jgi:hypothetical protein
MRYTIEGFGQVMAVKMNLDCDCLAILRWFVDFHGSNKMEFILQDKKPYYWVSYSKVIEDMPIISDKEDTIYRKFKKLVESKVLSIHTTREKLKNGKFKTYSYYTFDVNYNCLIDTECTELANIIDVKTKTKSLGKKSELNHSEKNPSCHSEKNPYKINLLTNSYSSIKNNNKSKNKKTVVVVSQDAKDISKKFKELYNADLHEERTQELIDKKGIETVTRYLNEYSDYIKGPDIGNLGGYYYDCVMIGYTKPVCANNTTTTQSIHNFDQREYAESEWDKHYANKNV